MKILYICTKGSVTDFYDALTEMNTHEITLFDNYKFDPNQENERGYQALASHLNKQHYDAVISLLYFPIVATMCHDKNIFYLSWIYDSPLISLFDPSVLYETNHIFIFDSYECQKLKEYGAKNVYFLPLAANTKRMQALTISDNDMKLFSSDISFVGSLYEKNTYNQLFSYIPNEYIQEWKQYLIENMCKWQTIRKWPRLSDTSTKFLTDNLPPENIRHFDMNTSEFLGVSILSHKLAEIERISALQACSTVAQTTLYSGSTCPEIPGLCKKGTIDYYTDMSKVFHLSRINLNITLPSIVCGVPQRIFDIMACGGFVLTNHQQDLEEQFKIGEDLETFSSLDELTDKARFYLTHESARLKIALNGFTTVSNQYSFMKQVQKMFELFQENIA